MSRNARLWLAANILLLVAFIFSVVVQYNDPDPLRWVLIYGLAAVACIFEMRRQRSWIFPLGIAVIALGWAATIEPHIAGRVDIPDMFASFEMKDEIIEQARETGGLLIVAAWMVILATVQYRRSRTSSLSPENIAHP